jgi:hypothetical protein
MSELEGMDISEITERMGYFPTYGHPPKIDEDDDFVYYLFAVPRHYIEDRILEGDKWEGYTPSTKPSTLDKSCILGVKFLPIYTKVSEVEADEDFIYFKARVPKAFLEHQSSYGFKYGIFYEMKEAWERKPEEEPEEMPTAGELVKQVMDSGKDPDLKDFIVQLKCHNDHIIDFPGHTAEDVWDILHEYEGCDRCGSTTMEVLFHKEGEDDEKED